MRRMLEIYALNAEEAAYLEGFRSWPISLANNSEVSGSVGSLGLLQRLITERVAAPEEVWKITALGVLFGDVLVNISERRLRWRMVYDSSGRTPALQWRNTDAVVYPLSALQSRLAAGEMVDVYALGNGLCQYAWI